MTKKHTVKGKTDNNYHYVIYQSPEMKNPMITISKYAMSAELEMAEKVEAYKKANPKTKK